MTKIAISSASRKPRSTATGRKSVHRPISFMKLAANAGPMPDFASLQLKAAPIAISPRGVVRPPRLETVLERMVGMGSRRTDHRAPDRMPRMIGFVIIPFNVFLISAGLMPFCPGFVKERTITAITL